MLDKGDKGNHHRPGEKLQGLITTPALLTLGGKGRGRNSEEGRKWGKPGNKPKQRLKNGGGRHITEIDC